MNYCSCSIFFAFFVLFSIATEATSDSNNTTNVIHMLPPNVANATKEMISKLNDTKKSNESDNVTAPKETVSELNKTKESGSMSVMPLRRDEPLTKLNQSKTELGENGEWVSFPDLEECDPSNRCVDEKNMFIACLRVPGTDSLALSLLIENNSTDLLEIKIFAPSFVSLEQSQVQLKAKEHKKVKVSLTDGAKDTTIILISQESHCRLDLRNTLLLETPRSSSHFVHLLTCVTVVCFLLVAVFFLVLSLFVKFRKNHPELGFLYQKPDLELPVSTGGREFSERHPENWDGWHDEEAPLTPSKPLSKPLSKGLNSRKINKEGWKT